MAFSAVFETLNNNVNTGYIFCRILVPCSAMVSLIFGVTTSVAIFPKRNENRVNLKTISVESASVTTEMTALKQHSQHCYPTITWKTYLTQMSLACSTSVYHLKRTTYLEKVFWRQEQ